MKKTIPYFLILLVLVGVAVLFFNQEFYRINPVDFDNAVVRTEDVSDIDFYVYYQETSGADYYDLAINQEISKTSRVHLVGEYKNDENRVMFFTSALTRYTNNAAPHLEESKSSFASNIEEWKPKEEFSPEFETSSSYEYKECATTPSQGEKEAYYMCLVARVINENYLFTLFLHGNGAITKDEVEYILEMVLKDKQDILERLP